MSYYNSGSNLAALAGFGQAQTSFQNAYNNAQSLQSNFTGMSSSFVTGASDMKMAAYYGLSAVDEMIDASAGYSSGNANYYANLSDSYASKARSFLRSQGY